MKANIRIDHQMVAVETENEVHAMMELTAPEAPDADKRAPINVALVLDRSGSMSGDKLDATKSCAAFLVDKCSPDDKVAVIAFDDEVDLVSPLSHIDRAELLRKIFNIHAGGSTNLSGGWLKGMEELKREQSGAPRKVVLLSDGQANVGIRDHEILCQLARGSLGDGRTTTTIGFGEGFDEDLLTAMADAGGGNAHFAATSDDAARIFAEEFEGLTSIVAQNLSVEIRPVVEEVDSIQILNEFPTVGVPGGVQIQLGDVYGQELRRIVFKLRVPTMAALGLAKIADVIVRYVSVGDQVEVHEVTVPITVNAVNGDEAEAELPDAAVTEEVTVLRAAQAQVEARRLADEGDYKSAQSILRSASEAIRLIAPGSKKAQALIEEAATMDRTSAQMLAGTYDAVSRKNLSYNLRQAQRRRIKPDDEDE